MCVRKKFPTFDDYYIFFLNTNWGTGGVIYPFTLGLTLALCGIYGGTKSGGKFFSYLYRLLKRSTLASNTPISVVRNLPLSGRQWIVSLVGKRKMVE
jgi:hypothetical protein